MSGIIDRCESFRACKEGIGEKGQAIAVRGWQRPKLDGTVRIKEHRFDRSGPLVRRSIDGR